MTLVAAPDQRSEAVPADRAFSQVQWALALFVAGLRTATFVQMLPSVVAAVDASPHRGLGVLTWAAAATGLLGIAGLALARRRPPDPPWVVADVLLLATLTLAGLATVPPDLRTGSWIGFHGAYAVAVVCSMGSVARRDHWLALLALVLGVRTVYLLPTVHSASDAATVVGELLTLLALAPLAWDGTRLMHRIAAEADRSRELAARLARENEERRARSAIHNGAAVMRLLVEQANAGSPAGRTSPEVWSQAAAELNRMRAYLAGRPDPGRDAADLAELVESVAAEFTDLPIHVVSDLARGVRLGDAHADVATALRSLLINVREHARASRAVIHAEELEAGHGWAVTLHDDGVGFDRATTPLGVGLRDLTLGQLAVHDITTRIDSVPGLGTTITLTHERTTP